MRAPDFHVHSTFSTLDGMGSPKQVVERAVQLGWSAVCLTEHGWMGSAPVLYKAARENNLNPIIGCEFYIVPNEILGIKGKETRSGSYHLTVLALSAEGYHNLVAWTTHAALRENFHYNPRISLDAMAEIAPYPLHHNVVLSGCMGSELCSALASANGNDINPEPFVAYIESMKSLFDNYYIELQNHAHPKFMDKEYLFYEEMVKSEAVVRDRLITLAYQTNTPTILTNDSHFQSADQRTSHLLMTANKRSGEGRVDTWSYMSQYGYFTNYMQPLEKIAERTPHLPGDALSNAIDIANEAAIRLDPLDDFKYSIPFSGYKDPVAKIEKRSRARLKTLYKIHGRKAVDKRFELELKTMADFSHYLLIMSDLIRYARKQGILTNTRGSAANSLVCYTLGIHDIDPMPGAYDLLFSRFVNPARPSLPDIDIDIQKGRFDDFMEFVQDYMREREGEGQVVQICNYGTLANRSTFRLIAEQLGMPKEEQDEMAKLLPQIIDSGLVDEENDVYEALKDSYPEIYNAATDLFDSVRNISQHACGWLFGTKDRPIEKWVPLTLIVSSGRMVTQYNMKTLEDMGLNKGDFLRLRTLDVIQNTRKLLGQDSLDITDIPLDDPKTFEMLREGRTEGVFTLQGSENRKGCMEVEVENVHDVIKTVAIYRPALTREHKHDLYNDRRKGKVNVNYAHPVVEEVLGSTYGVPVFQEQVMELSYKIGMTDAEVYKVYKAIKLAKGVGRGAKEAFDEIEPTARKRAKENGFTEEETEEIWTEIRSSQGYGFNKGHASSYGILAVRAAYLKANHPAEFFTSLLDVYPEKAKYVAAARSEGFQFLPPDVNSSGRGFSLDGTSIRVGLSRVAGLGPVSITNIIDNAPYSSLEDFKARTNSQAVTKPRVETLAALGALESLGVKKTADDAEEFYVMGFTLNKPKALNGIKPLHARARTSERGWEHRGRERGVELTQGRASVSKLFWIPSVEDDRHYKGFQIKASQYAQARRAALLLVIDENGLPFHLMADEEKAGEVGILKVLGEKFRGYSFCADGAVRNPFATDGPMGFRFYGITGADFQRDPQLWRPDGTPAGGKVKLGFVGLHEIKRKLRKAA